MNSSLIVYFQFMASCFFFSVVVLILLVLYFLGVFVHVVIYSFGPSFIFNESLLTCSCFTGVIVSFFAVWRHYLNVLWHQILSIFYVIATCAIWVFRPSMSIIPRIDHGTSLVPQQKQCMVNLI